MNSSPRSFFCDHALVDINAFACSANRLLCHGSIHGAFGKGLCNRPPTDISSIDVLVVSLEHLSSEALSDDYVFHLVFLNDDAYQKIWLGEKKSPVPSLSKICVQRDISRFAIAPKIKKSILERKAREYMVTEFDSSKALDNYVPYEYRMDFLNHFRGFIVRSDVHTTSLPHLIRSHGFAASLQHNVKDMMDGEMQVLGFGKRSADVSSLANSEHSLRMAN
jgi:hypothetical protein